MYSFRCSLEFLYGSFSSKKWVSRCNARLPIELRQFRMAELAYTVTRDDSDAFIDLRNLLTTERTTSSHSIDGNLTFQLAYTISGKSGCALTPKLSSRVPAQSIIAGMTKSRQVIRSRLKFSNGRLRLV
jgi:hypothetical protein